MKSSNPFEVLRQVTSKSSLNTTSSSDSCRNVISSSASSASCENSTSTSSGNSTSTSIQSGNSTSTNSQSGNSTLASSSTTVNNAIVPVIKNHTKPLPSENIYRLDENSLLIALTETFKISFHGRVIIKVLHGKLQIFGYVLDEESKAYPCYNPLVQSLHCMEISPCTRSKKTWNFEQKVNDFMNRFADIATIIQLSDLTFDGLDELEFEYPEFNLFNPVLPLPYDERMSLRGFYPFHNTPKLFPELQLDTEWIEFADKVVKSSSVSAICGPKNVGKSSFSRYLVNRLLNQHQQVAYLECDIGQPEFTMMGLVSLTLIQDPLLGPPFTHQKEPIRSFFIGSNSPESNPSLYFNSIVALMDYYHIHLRPNKIPLIVNTQGWITGLGYDLLLQILQYILPDHIAQIFPSLSRTGVIEIKEKCTIWAENSNDLTLWNPIFSHLTAPIIDVCPYRPKVSAHDLRVLSKIMYFSSCKLQNSFPVWRFIPLTLQVPVSVQMNEISLSFVNDEMVSHDELFKIFNASMVALVTNETSDNEVIIKCPQPTPEFGHCIALGIIRCITLDKNGDATFYIITPGKNLESANTLVKGVIEIPPCMLYQDRRIVNAPYTDNYSIEGIVGNTCRKVRRNLVRTIK